MNNKVISIYWKDEPLSIDVGYNIEGGSSGYDDEPPSNAEIEIISLEVGNKRVKIYTCKCEFYYFLLEEMYNLLIVDNSNREV